MIFRGEPLNDIQKARFMQDGPDCDECLGGEDGATILMPGNEDAWNVYQAIQGQLILGMGGPVSISHLAVWAYLDRFEHRLSKPKNTVFEQVCNVAQKIINDQSEEARIERELKASASK